MFLFCWRFCPRFGRRTQALLSAAGSAVVATTCLPRFWLPILDPRTNSPLLGYVLGSLICMSVVVQTFFPGPVPTVDSASRRRLAWRFSAEK